MPSSSDNFRKITNNFSTTTSGFSSTDTTFSVNSVAGLPTDTGIDLVVDRVDSTGNQTPTKREYVRGIVVGNTITSLIRGLGNSTAQQHGNGAVVEMVWTADTHNDMVSTLLSAHNQDGSIKAGSIYSSSQLGSGIITSSQLAPLAVTTGAIVDANVTIGKLAAGTTSTGWNEYHPLTAPVIPNGYTVYNTVTATTSGNRVEVMSIVHIQDGSSGAIRSGHYKIQVDGVDVPNTDRIYQTPFSGAYISGSVMGSSTPTAGSHTWTFLVSADTPTASLLLHSTLSVREVR